MGFSRGSRARNQSRSPIRLTDWNLGAASTGQSVTATGKTSWSTGVITTEPVTLIRQHGIVELQLQSVGTAGDGFIGACGIGLVSDEAFAIGATAVPDPSLQADWDGWIWHSYFSIHSITATIGDAVNGPSVVQKLVIDSKAMRKWDPSMSLIGMIGVFEAGAASLRFIAESRLLVKV